MDDIISLLQVFVSGADRSVGWAKMTETALDDAAAENDPRFEELRDYLASYRPAGGEYLYGQAEMLRVCQASLEVITKKNDYCGRKESKPKQDRSPMTQEDLIISRSKLSWELLERYPVWGSFTDDDSETISSG